MNNLTKYVLIGQPRSGTTFLVSLLMQSTNAICENELFNPYQISYFNAKNDQGDEGALVEREKSPVEFIDNFYEKSFESGAKVAGFNFMLGHNLDALNYLLAQDDIKIIYLRRENKIAQYASWKKAVDSKAWATRSEKEAEKQRKNKIKFSIEDYNKEQSPISFMDYVFSSILDGINDNRVFRVEYRDLFNKDKQNELFKFINAKQIKRLESDPIKKQGNNNISNRFENKTLLKEYLSAIDKEHWMKSELKNNRYEKYVLIAQTRTGSNYLMSEINNRTSAFCDGELFNPKQVCHYGDLENQPEVETLINRDSDPIKFVNSFYNQKVFDGEDAIGFKYMLGHSFDIFDYLLEETDYKIIYLSRENKLAQFSSLISALQSKTWATHDPDYAQRLKETKIDFDLGTYLNRSGTLQSLDYFAKKRLEKINQERVMYVEYSDMFHDDFLKKLCAFLKSKEKSKGKNPIQKQSLNHIRSRFNNDVDDYFNRIGQQEWLDDEIVTLSDKQNN